MGREQIGIDVEVFAKDGDRIALPTYAEGYTSEYEGNTFPSRQGLNDVLAKVSAVANDVNVFGAGLPWDSGISYKVGAPVMRNGVFYVAINDNTNSDPALVPANWTTLANFLGIKSDIEYRALSSHSSQPLKQTVSGTHNYTVSGFVGAGINPSDIRGVWITCHWHVPFYSGNYCKVYAIYPDGTTRKILSTDPDSGSEYKVTNEQVFFVPINNGQTTFTIKCYFGNGSDYVRLFGINQATI